MKIQYHQQVIVCSGSCQRTYHSIPIFFIQQLRAKAEQQKHRTINIKNNQCFNMLWVEHHPLDHFYQFNIPIQSMQFIPYILISSSCKHDLFAYPLIMTPVNIHVYELAYRTIHSLIHLQFIMVPVSTPGMSNVLSVKQVFME